MCVCVCMKLSVFGLCTWKQILTADEMPGSQVQFFWKISVHNMHSLFSGINVKLRFLCFTLNYHLSAFSNFLLQEILGLWDSPKWNIICKPLWRDPGTQKCSVIDHLCYFPSLGANHTFWPCLWIMALIICVISKHVRTGGQQLCSGQSIPTVGHPKSWGGALMPDDRHSWIFGTIPFPYIVTLQIHQLWVPLTPEETSHLFRFPRKQLLLMATACCLCQYSK